MELLFENLAKKLSLTPARVRKFKDWIESADKARQAGLLDAKTNQYDKAEELVTFYTFAPLELREDKIDVVEEILKLANVHEALEEPVYLSLERLLQSPEGYRKWLANEVGKHPLRYVREQGKKHISKRQPLEGMTHVDVAIETKSLLVLVEVKFTSDISPEIDFDANRNQLARTIDAGISEAERKGKQLVVLLCSPSEFYRKKSRLYYYKVEEYADFGKIAEDIRWREFGEIQKYLKAVAWVPLEKVIEVIYRDLDHPQSGEARDFFRERMLG